MTIDLEHVQETVGAVVRKRMASTSVNRRADIAEETVSAVCEELAKLDAQACDAVLTDYAALWRLCDAERAAIVRAAQSVDRMKAGRAYRSDEIRVRGLKPDDMTLPEKRAVVGRLTHVDALSATEDKLDAVLWALKTAGVWDALALRPSHEASHVGHLRELVGAWSASGEESDYAQALRYAADPDKVSGALGELLRTLSDAAPAWTDHERASAWHLARRAHDSGAALHAAGDHYGAQRVVLALFDADTSDDPTDHATDHAGDTFALTAPARETGAQSVPWGDALARIGALSDSPAVRRARSAAREWAHAVRSAAQHHCAADRAVVAGNGVPSPVTAPTGERVRFYVRSTAWQAAQYRQNAALRIARTWYEAGANAYGRGDRASAWRIVSMLASGDVLDVSSPLAYAGAHSVPVARGTRDAAQRGTSGAHVVSYSAAGAVTHVPGDASVLSDVRYPVRAVTHPNPRRAAGYHGPAY